MTPNVTLAVLAGTLVGCGVVLLLSRSLVRALLGVLLLGNGINVVFMVASGAPGRSPIVTKETAATTTIGPDGISDPLPQAMVLTAIVITLAVTGYCLALAHRQWQLARTDDLEDDAEDARIAELAGRGDLSGSDYTDTSDPQRLADDAEDAGPDQAPRDTVGAATGHAQSAAPGERCPDDGEDATDHGGPDAGDVGEPPDPPADEPGDRPDDHPRASPSPDECAAPGSHAHDADDRDREEDR